MLKCYIIVRSILVHFQFRVLLSFLQLNYFLNKHYNVAMVGGVPNMTSCRMTIREVKKVEKVNIPIQIVGMQLN